MKKIIQTAAALAVSALLLAGCSGTDVVLKYSQESFDNILKTYPDVSGGEQDGYYPLTVDGETALHVSANYKDAGGQDIVLSTPLQPFEDAGLDVSRLPENYRAEDGVLYLDTDFGDGTGETDSPGDALFQSVAADRKALSYHEELDHYGIALSGGKFEFAKDHEKNDKDLVFVLNADPLAQAGADVRKIDGWVFQTMDDGMGKKMDVLLKPYDLK